MLYRSIIEMAARTRHSHIHTPLHITCYTCIYTRPTRHTVAILEYKLIFNTPTTTGLTCDTDDEVGVVVS